MKHLAAISLIASTVALGSVAHAESPAEKAQEIRQAPMVLIGNNFGYMVGMLKGEIPWNSAEFQKRANELSAMGQLDMTRGYQMPGSYKGHTKASTDILKNTADFEEKMSKLRQDLRALESKLGDETALKSAVKDLGQNCKSCHKEYKNKDYNG